MGWLSKSKNITVLSPVEGYDLWASSYSSEKNPIKNLSDELVEKFLPPLTGKSVLDAGCGTGKFCAFALKQNAKSVHGYDLSSAMIEFAKQNCPSANFECVDLSLAKLTSNDFDVVICGLVLGHIEILENALYNLLNGLKTDGTIIITDFHPYLTLLHSKRTFNDSRSGQKYEIKHYLHLFNEYFKAFKKFGLVIDEFEEPKYNDSPVVFGIRGRKISG